MGSLALGSLNAGTLSKGALACGPLSGRPVAIPEWQTTNKLRWSPPAQSSPVTWTVPTGFAQSPVYADDQDVIVVMPASARNVNSDFELRGGRNIRLIGGHARSRMMFKDITGSVYIEGLKIDMTGAPNKDALNIYGTAGFQPDVYIQCTRIVGVQGTNAGTHADIYQPQGPIGDLRVDRLSGDTNYQGLFLRPEFLIRSSTISRANLGFNVLGTPENNTYLYWFRNTVGDSLAPGQNPLPPVSLYEVYAAQHKTRTPAQAAAYPPPGEPTTGEPSSGAFAAVRASDGSMSWPAGSMITGAVKMGAPTAGDFVTDAQAGLSYVSPGYSA